MKAFYFPHDDNAAGDERVLKLRAKFGNTEGYAMWFMLLEYLSRNGGYMQGELMAELSLSYSIPPEKWKEFIDFCVSISLLKNSKNGVFSYRLVEHIGYRKERVESGKKGAKVRWSSQNKDDSSAIAQLIAEPIAGEERRGEERKDIKKPTKKSGLLEEMPEEKPKRVERTDDETLQLFFDIAEKNELTTPDYREAKTKQFHSLDKVGKDEILTKMRVMINCTYSKSSSTQGLARKIYFETVGLIQDRALDKGTIDGKVIAKRREFAKEELGNNYVESEIDNAPF